MIWETILHTQFKETLDDFGYVFFTRHIYNLNIIGLRSENDNSNLFDDTLCIIYRNRRLEWTVTRYPITTDPGRPYLEKPMRPEGCAILVPGQYRSVYEYGLHRGQYNALVQRGEMAVWRDNNKNNILDRSGPQYVDDSFGLNIHKAGANSPSVEWWSAGCQVFKYSRDFADFMGLCRLQQRCFPRGGNRYTYTLIDIEDAPKLKQFLL